MKTRVGRLGIFGGTFNPVHLGHLRLAEDVREEFRLEKIIFIPTNAPPHKSTKNLISPSTRLKMVEIAIEDNDCFLCEDVEIKRGGLSYTIDTVSYIFENYQFEAKPFLIIGSDLFRELHTWKHIDQVVRKVRFIVMLRNNYPIVCPAGDGIMDLTYDPFNKRKIEITSSEIRERLRVGKSIRYLVPEGVFHYIIEKGLYRADSEY